jgi:glycerol-3-phosphate acyltransferase PlsY
MLEWTGHLIIAFLIGAIPFGVIVSRLFYKRDLRASGSGNIGAANALRTLGKRGAIAVLLLDAFKGAAPVLLTVPHYEQAAAVGFAAILGHCFSPFLAFRGGKGVATSLGVIFALAWPAGLAFMLVWIAFAIGLGFASVSSMAASIAMPYVLWFIIGGPGMWYGIASAILIVATHRQNIERLRTGTENRLSLFAKRVR